MEQGIFIIDMLQVYEVINSTLILICISLLIECLEKLLTLIDGFIESSLSESNEVQFGQLVYPPSSVFVNFFCSLWGSLISSKNVSK